MTYPEAIQYLESFINYEKIPFWPYKQSLKLERIKDFLASINNPQAGLRYIHVAGTKGKGSTCAFLAYILREAGYKTGLYTSPHLSDFRERIRILHPRSKTLDPKPDFEGMISEADLIGLIKRLKPAIDKYNQGSKYGALSFFEVYTALAYVYFKEEKVDFAVLETGLGGRLDATNVVEPLTCVITPISYEHTDKLGGTLKEIAMEKAGIIKRHNVITSQRHKLVVISAPQEEEGRSVIRERCKSTNAKLFEVGKDITYKNKGRTFEVSGISGKYRDFKIKLLGEHQKINATSAVAAIEALMMNGINIRAKHIKNGFYNTIWPGRCEIVSKNPFVVLDGAQNVASARRLKETIKENFRYKRMILILGVSKDKDIKGICNELYEISDEVILTKASNPRAADLQTLAGYFNGKPQHLTKNIQEAKNKGFDLAKSEDLILVCGSLFVVGEYRNDKVRS